MKKYSFIFSYFKKRNMIVLISMMLLASILSLCPPYMISYILHNGVVRASRGTIISGGIFLICIYAGSFFVHYFISQTLTKVSSYFIADLKNDLFMRILKLPMEFFDNKQTGYVLERMKETDALKKVGLTISEFENGLHSMVNENGKNLSGGQRQKIALARMIIKNPDVMIFDEATSNLDVAASDLLKQSIHSIFADKICIIITHDPQMASVADTILNLSDETQHL